MLPEQNHRRIRPIFAFVNIRFAHAKRSIRQFNQTRLIARIFFRTRFGCLPRVLPHLFARFIPRTKTFHRHGVEDDTNVADRGKKPRALAVVKTAPAKRCGHQQARRRRQHQNVILQHAPHADRKAKSLVEQAFVFSAIRRKTLAIPGQRKRNIVSHGQGCFDQQIGCLRPRRARRQQQ